MDPYDLHTRDILQEIENNGSVSQRVLSRKLGIALGRTNLLVRRLVTRGWVKRRAVKPNRVSYRITPAGLREKARITRAYFENTVRLYGETRGLVRESLARLSATWPTEESDAGGEKRIVFYGAGEVAEIGYVSLQDTDLRLVGVVDDRPRGPFFGLPVCAPDRLGPTHLDGVPYGRLVIMSFRNANHVVGRLEARGVSRDRVYSLYGDPARSTV